jgi:HK97 family phage major capsid protein
MVVTTGNIPSGLLPPTVTAPIFEKAVESSAVMSLARRVPLSMTAQTSIPVSMGIPAAGWVEQGAAKPVGSAGLSVKTMTGKKVALILPVAEEVARGNPAGLYAQLQQDLPTAIARAFDHAAIHGVDLRTGGAGPFDDYLKNGATSIELGTTSTANGGVYVVRLHRLRG